MRSSLNQALIVVVAMMSVAAIGCGTSSTGAEPTQLPAPTPTVAPPESTVAPEPTATPIPPPPTRTPAPDPTATPVRLPATSTPVPEPTADSASGQTAKATSREDAKSGAVIDFIAGESIGSDVDDPDVTQIRFRAGERYEAFRVKDWDAYLESCLPSVREQVTKENLEFDYDFLVRGTVFTPGGFSQQVGGVQLLGPFDAIVTKYLYEYDEVWVPSRSYGGDLAEIWTKIDGEWYSAGCSHLR